MTVEGRNSFVESCELFELIVILKKYNNTFIKINKTINFKMYMLYSAFNLINN